MRLLSGFAKLLMVTLMLVVTVVGFLMILVAITNV